MDEVLYISGSYQLVPGFSEKPIAYCLKYEIIKSPSWHDKETIKQNNKFFNIKS